MKFIGYLIKSAFTVAFLATAGAFYVSMFFVLFDNFDTENFGAMSTVLIFAPLMIGLCTWIINKFLGFICIRNPVAYWGFTLGCVIVSFVMALNGTLFLLFPNVSAPFAIFSVEMIITFFLIPQLAGVTNTYNVQEIRFYDGCKITYREWKEESYTPGWWIKLITQIIISVVIALIYNLAPNVMTWVIFLVQGGFTAVLFVLNIKNYFFS